MFTNSIMVVQRGSLASLRIPEPQNKRRVQEHRSGLHTGRPLITSFRATGWTMIHNARRQIQTNRSQFCMKITLLLVICGTNHKLHKKNDTLPWYVLLWWKQKSDSLWFEFARVSWSPLRGGLQASSSSPSGNQKWCTVSVLSGGVALSIQAQSKTHQ